MMKTYQNHAMTDAEARQALADACKQVETNLPLYTYQCQNHSSVNDIYPGCANNQWTCGFWPGEIWLAYEATGEEKFKTAALIQVDSFADRIARKVEVDHHDMGFLYSPTCVAAWKLVGSEKGKNAAIAAADQLLTRYQPSGRFLQAWGTMDDPGNYRYIIDCMLNVPLLYWAAQALAANGWFVDRLDLKLTESVEFPEMIACMERVVDEWRKAALEHAAESGGAAVAGRHQIALHTLISAFRKTGIARGAAHPGTQSAVIRQAQVGHSRAAAGNCRQPDAANLRR